jgi:hypothetical protein
MRWRRKLFLAAGFAALGGVLPEASPAQWTRLQRCGGALPCAIPFGVRYSPDPLLASQYGRIAPTAISGRVSLEPKVAVALDQPRLSLEQRDFAAEAARRFLIANPPPAEHGGLASRPAPTQPPPPVDH